MEAKLEITHKEVKKGREHGRTSEARVSQQLSSQPGMKKEGDALGRFVLWAFSDEQIATKKTHLR